MKNPHLTPYLKNAIDLRRYGNGLGREMVEVYTEAAESLLRGFAEAEGSTETRMARLNAQAEQIRDTITSAYQNQYPQLINQLTELANQQVGFNATTLGAIANDAGVNVSVNTVAVSPQYVQALARGEVELGIKTSAGEFITRSLPKLMPDDQPLSEAIAELASASSRQMMGILRSELLLGKTNDEIVRGLLRGRRIPKGSPLKKTERAIRNVVQGAVIGTASEAQALTIKANPDITEQYEFVATLDSRTTLICMATDGKVYNVNDAQAPRPPLHIGCRSTTVPYLGDLSQGGTRASEQGQVDSDLDYEAWLRQQPPEYQDEALGKGKADLFRGGMSLSQMVREDGSELTLTELGGDRQNVPARLSETLLDFSVKSEVSDLSTKTVKRPSFTNSQYEAAEYLAYQDAKILVEANRDASLLADFSKSEIIDAIDKGIAPPQEILDKFKFSKSQKEQAANNKKNLDSAKLLISESEKILSQKTISNPSQWKPQMTRDEVDEYFGDNNYFGEQSFWHGNRTAVTESMKSEGAISERNTRGAYGKGVYAGASKGIGLTYGNPYMGDSELLEMRIYSQNPYITDSTTMKKLTEDVLQAEGYDNDVRVLLKTKGYDSIYIKDEGYIVAFDKEQVVIVDSAKPSQLDANVEEFTSFEREKVSAFQAAMQEERNSSDDFGEELLSYFEDEFDF